jgi:hypothetical protein
VGIDQPVEENSAANAGRDHLKEQGSLATSGSYKKCIEKNQKYADIIDSKAIAQRRITFKRNGNG